MLKRTKGILLLTLLVLTGMAGRMSSETINGQERKILLAHLKDTRNDLLKSVKGLSEAQLIFKPSEEKWSVKECVQHLALSESNIWNMAAGVLKATANPEMRSEIKMTDEELYKALASRSNKVQTSEAFKPEQAPWKTTSEALNAFREKRASLIKYTKTTTDDMRNHVGQTPLGHLDAYQMLILLAAHTKRHTMQIDEIKADAAFPK